MGSLATSTSAAVSRTPSAATATQAGTPLLRISPCSKDANLLATFHLDSSTVLILDIRQPGKELYNLVAHTGNVEASMVHYERVSYYSPMGTIVTTCACEWRR